MHLFVDWCPLLRGFRGKNDQKRKGFKIDNCFKNEERETGNGKSGKIRILLAHVEFRSGGDQKRTN